MNVNLELFSNVKGGDNFEVQTDLQVGASPASKG